MATDTVVEVEEEEQGDRDETVIIDTPVIDKVQAEDNDEENLPNVMEAQNDPEDEEHRLAGSRTASNRSRRSSRSASRGSGGGGGAEVPVGGGGALWI